MNNANHALPAPHDDRKLGYTPQEIVEKLNDILSEPAMNLSDEAAQLHDAHEVLQEALR